MSAHVRDRLEAYLDQELSADDRAEVSRHLSGCSECRRLLEELAAVDDAARSVPVDAPEGYFDTFAARVRQRLGSEPRRRAFRPPVWSLAVAAALLLAVITPLTLREHTTPPQAAPAAAARAGGPAASAPPVVGAPEGPAAQPSLARSNKAATDELKKEAVARPAEEKDKTATVDQAQAENDVAVAPERPRAPAPGAGGSARNAPEGKVRPWAGEPEAEPKPQLAPLPASEPRQAESSAAGAAAAPSEEAIAPARRLAPGVVAERRAALMDRAGAAGEARYRSLKGRTASTAEEARALREQWRSFAASPLAGPHADDARVAAIEAGARAYAFSHDDDDRAAAETDARAYLARKDAAQAEKVRELLANLDR
jgi:Putative zinc-finger